MQIAVFLEAVGEANKPIFWVVKVADDDGLRTVGQFRDRELAHACAVSMQQPDVPLRTMEHPIESPSDREAAKQIAVVRLREMLERVRDLG